METPLGAGVGNGVFVGLGVDVGRGVAVFVEMGVEVVDGVSVADTKAPPPLHANTNTATVSTLTTLKNLRSFFILHVSLNVEFEARIGYKTPRQINSLLL